MAKFLRDAMKKLGFSELIRISGKSSFDQLTKPEVALMIESFLEGGNESFDPLAFNDFLHAELENEEMKKVRDDLRKNAFLPAKGDEWPAINHSYLKNLSEDLRK